MKEKIYYVAGMHCGACELLVEKRLLKEKGVQAVDVSISNKKVRLEYKHHAPNVQELNNWFKEDGYTFSEQQKEEKKEPLFYFVYGTGIQINMKVFRRKVKTLLKIAIVFLILYLLEKTGATAYVNVSKGSSLGLFFAFGLVAGLSSCAALVGGILLSLTKTWNEASGYEATLKTKMIPQAYFHTGRLVAYALLGALLGAIGKAVTLENVTIYAVITILVSLVMLIIGLQMAGVRWAEKFQLRMPKAITRRIAKNNGGVGKRLPFSIGAGTVLLPCGFTLVTQGIALTSGSAITGLLIMASFVIGTMIPLIFIGLASAQGTKNPKRARTFSFYAGVVLVLFSFYNINGQINVLGLPSLSNIFAKEKTTPKTSRTITNAQGEQVVNLLAKGFSYSIISGGTVQAGVPTTLIVDNQGIRGCGVFLASRGLISGYVELQPGKNTISLGKPTKGTYKITCSMGMVAPVTLYVK